MLKLLRAHCVADKLKLLDTTDIRNQQWVVADLKSKMFLRQRLHKKYPLLSDACVLRANDLWTTWLQQLRPELKQVPDETIELIALSELRRLDLEQDGENSIHLESLAEHLRDYMDQMVSLLNHPEGNQIIADFFKEEPSAKARWGKWYDLAEAVWPQIDQVKVFSNKWSASLLLEMDWQNRIPLKEKYVFDLGFQLDHVEFEMIEKISGYADVTLIEPVHEGPQQRSYQLAEVAAEKIEVIPKNSLDGRGEETVLRMTTPLAEIKDAIARIRGLLDSGVALDDIAIAVGALEEYWPVLSSYLMVEGIPFRKHLTVRLDTMPGMQVWLSRLRSVLKPNRFSDLEQSGYNHFAEPEQSFNKFRYLFEKIFEEVNIGALDKPIDIKQKNSKIQFLKWATGYFPDLGLKEHLEEALVCYFSQTPSSFAMSLHQHLFLFEKLLSRREVVIEKGAEEGIEIFPIFTMEYTPSTHLFLLGLDSQSLRPTQRTQISLSDASQLAGKTGMHVPHVEQMDVGLELDWLNLSGDCQVYKYFSESNFSGVAQTPSLYWLIAAKQNDSLSIKVPQSSRWDELQKVPLSQLGEIKSWSRTRCEQVIRRVDQDLGAVENDHFPGLKLRYSSSLVENYYTCPFWVTARKVFRLDDEASVDMDLDAAKQGRLMHKIFEVVKNQQVPAEEAVETAYTEILAERSSLMQDERIWNVVKKRYIKLAELFLAMETDFKVSHPQWKMKSSEKKIEMFFDLEQKKMVKHSTDYPFIAYVDRIDENQSGQLIVMDYKSSGARLSHHGNWMKDQSIQLPVYTLLSELEYESDVVAATYYVAKDSRRDMGFILDEEESLQDQTSRFNKISRSAKIELIEKTEQLIGEAIEKVAAGQLPPVPSDVKECIGCRWRRLCRAPHLN